MDVHPDVIIFSGLRILGDARLTIAEGVFINHDCVLDCAAPVSIGRNVSLANEVMVLTSEHVMDDPAQRGGPRTLTGVSIGAGSWIGARAVILAGVVVAPGVVVAAGALVNRPCATNGLYGGVPARLVRYLGAASLDGPE